MTKIQKFLIILLSIKKIKSIYCPQGFNPICNGNICRDINECSEIDEIGEPKYCKERLNPNCVNVPGGHVCTREKWECGENSRLFRDGNGCCDLDPNETCGLTSYYKEYEMYATPRENVNCDNVIQNNQLSTFKRIMGGRRPQISGQWPWLALIYVFYKEKSSICGGTLVDYEHILTAAHCFDEVIGQDQVGLPSEIYVYLGVDRTDITELANPLEYLQNNKSIIVQNLDMNNIIIHDEYDGAQLNDIAIVKLSNELTAYGHYKDIENMPLIRPVCLPNGEEPKPGQRCWAAGWGQKFSLQDVESGRKTMEELHTSELLEIGIDVGQIRDCGRGMSKNHEDYQAYTTAFRSDRMFCAGNSMGEVDACQGDSGGGLICQRCDSCNFYIAGVISFGAGCGVQNRYSIFQKATFYESWIRNVTRIKTNTYSKNMSHIKKKCDRTAPNKYGLWSEWSDCQIKGGQSCGSGKRFRFRTCNNGLKMCDEHPSEVENCVKSKDQCQPRTKCPSMLYLNFQPTGEYYSKHYTEFSGIYINEKDGFQYRHSSGHELIKQSWQGQTYWNLYNLIGARIASSKPNSLGCPSFNPNYWGIQIVLPADAQEDFKRAHNVKEVPKIHWISGPQFSFDIRQHSDLNPSSDCPIEFYLHKNSTELTHYTISENGNYFSDNGETVFSREIVQGELYWVYKMNPELKDPSVLGRMENKQSESESDSEQTSSNIPPKSQISDNLLGYLKTSGCPYLDDQTENNWFIWEDNNWHEICYSDDCKRSPEYFYLSYSSEKTNSVNSELIAKCKEKKRDRSRINDSCGSWANQGYCESYPAHMMLHCLKRGFVS